MNEKVEPVAVLPIKRKKAIMNWKLCVFCQSPKKGINLSKASRQGIERIIEAYNIRKTHNDESMHEILHSIEWDHASITENNPVWHKQCYASFTSKFNLQVLTERYQKQHAREHTVDQEQDAVVAHTPLTRSATKSVDYSLCIFCQTRKRESVIQVQSKEVSDVIKRVAMHNCKVKCRVVDNDPIVNQVHYHKSCKYQAEKSLGMVAGSSSTSLSETEPRQACFSNLVQTLDAGLEQGFVYSMDEVFNKYTSKLQAAGISKQSPHSHKLKLKLQSHYGDRITFRRQTTRRSPSFCFQL